jgi:hypothetical protein
LEPGPLDDSLYFRANPDRAHRARRPYPNEFGADKRRIDVVAVRQLRPGQRERRTFTMTVCEERLLPVMERLIQAALEGDENAAHALFDFTPGHYDRAEALAHIGSYTIEATQQ